MKLQISNFIYILWHKKIEKIEKIGKIKRKGEINEQKWKKKIGMHQGFRVSSQSMSQNVFWVLLKLFLIKQPSACIYCDNGNLEHSQEAEEKENAQKCRLGQTHLTRFWAEIVFWNCKNERKMNEKKAKKCKKRSKVHFWALTNNFFALDYGAEAIPSTWLRSWLWNVVDNRKNRGRFLALPHHVLGCFNFKNKNSISENFQISSKIYLFLSCD